MFNEVGRKIKTFAKVLFGIQFALFLLVGGMLFDLYSQVVGIIVIFVGLLVAWIGNFVLYGFGEIVDMSVKNNEQLDNLRLKTFEINGRVSQIQKTLLDMNTEKEE